MDRAQGVTNACTDTSSFITDVEFMTVLGLDKDLTSDQFTQATSAAGCCNACFTQGKGTCAGWFFNPSSKFTPCAMVMIKTGGPGADDSCPNGYAASLEINKGGDGVAGKGPCLTDGNT